MRQKENETGAETTRKPRLLDIAAASEYLCVGDKVVRQLVREGRLQRVMLSPKRYLFDIQDLDRLIEGEKSEATEQQPAVRAAVPKKLYGKKAAPYEWAERFGVKRP